MAENQISLQHKIAVVVGLLTLPVSGLTIWLWNHRDIAQAIGNFIYNFQTLITGLIALVGFYFLSQQVKEAQNGRRATIRLAFEGAFEGNRWARDLAQAYSSQLRSGEQLPPIHDATVEIILKQATPAVAATFGVFKRCADIYRALPAGSDVEKIKDALRRSADLVVELADQEDARMNALISI